MGHYEEKETERERQCVFMCVVEWGEGRMEFVCLCLYVRLTIFVSVFMSDGPAVTLIISSLFFFY